MTNRGPLSLLLSCTVECIYDLALQAIRFRNITRVLLCCKIAPTPFCNADKLPREQADP
jgi:hypothetical protein